MTFRNAIIQSKNTVAVRTLQEDVGTDLALKYLTENFHFSSIDMVNDAVDVLAIGGITNGVSNLELTAAFASIATRDSIPAQYSTPKFWIRGQRSVENPADNPETSTAIKPTTAYELTSAMEDVITNPCRYCSLLCKSSQHDHRGKTGTTDNYKDTWFVGYSPYYTAGIWFGYDNNIDPTSRPGFQLYQHEVLWGRNHDPD